MSKLIRNMIYVIFRMFSDIFLNTVYAADEAENYDEILKYVQ